METLAPIVNNPANHSRNNFILHLIVRADCLEMLILTMLHSLSDHLYWIIYIPGKFILNHNKNQGILQMKMSFLCQIIIFIYKFLQAYTLNYIDMS